MSRGLTRTYADQMPEEARTPFNSDEFSMLKMGLYVSILTGGATIFESLDMLPRGEAFLVCGLLAVIAVLILEPRKEKLASGLLWLNGVLGLYLFMYKLPELLLPRLNYYVTYFIAFVLMAVVTIGIPLLWRLRRARLNNLAA